MNHVERFKAVMAFEPVDRLPVIEWAFWWNDTVARWHNEGLNPQLKDAAQIRDHLGLDCYRHLWVNPFNDATPKAPSHGAPIINNQADYERILPALYPDVDTLFDNDIMQQWAAAHQRGDMVVWLTVLGFFWWPRVLFGIEPHLFAFYDHPDLMHRMNQDVTDFNIKVIERFCDYLNPEFMTFAEDLSYNHGPMLSQQQFETFIAPYYNRIIPIAKSHGIIPFMDSDGDIMPIIPWLESVGIEGLLPLERMAGVDINLIRQRHPRWKMIGAFDKTVMHLGEKAIRDEFERVLPVMRSGGYIPSVDHQTPPGVSFQDYHLYKKLLWEYAQKAAK